jgi:hypothetical protein
MTTCEDSLPSKTGPNRLNMLSIARLLFFVACVMTLFTVSFRMLEKAC